MEKKFLRMLMTVLLVYVLCYLPFQTMYLVYEFHPMLFTSCYMQPLSEFLYLLVWLPNALNPVCYGCLNDYYKRAFKALIFHPRKFIQGLKSRQSFSQSVVATTVKRWNRFGWRRLLSACRFGQDLADRNLSFNPFYRYRLQGEKIMVIIMMWTPMVFLLMKSTSLWCNRRYTLLYSSRAILTKKRSRFSLSPNFAKDNAAITVRMRLTLSWLRGW